MLEVMSDTCMYEFEDNVWDEFCESDDHIVPDPGSNHADDDPILDDSHKKHRHEVISISSNSGDRSGAGCFDQQRQSKGFSSLSKRNIIPEKDSWCHSPSGIFPSSSGTDSMKEPSSLVSDNTMPSSHDFKSNNADSNSGDKCSNDTILGCKTTTVDNNSFSHPPADMTHSNNNLDFFENTEDKESNDLLYYGWPEIGNFEDVDRIFRTCDTTFGLGASNEDELGWLSSADNMGCCGDVLKSDFTFPCPESNAAENIQESAMTSAHVRYKDTSWISENSDSYLSSVNGPAIADSKDGLITKEQGIGLNGKIQPRMSTYDLSKTGSSRIVHQVNDHKKQLKPKNQSMRKSKELYSGNVSFGYMSNLTDEATQFPPGGTSHQAYPFVGVQHQLQHEAFGADSCSYLQNPLCYVHSDSSQFSVNPMPSAVKSETNEPKKRERLHNHQGLNSSPQNARTAMHASICNPGSKGHFSVENRSDTEGMILHIPAGLVSSNVQERSMMSSGLNDTPEAASFHQLQLVMEQLDLRTKLCIRDSMYRLARSAEQRHNQANLNGDEKDVSGAFMAEGTKNFMDMETDTNPLDRSIAHLLFHRPSESSTIPSDVRESATNPLVAGENLVICDETASELDKELDR